MIAVAESLTGGQLASALASAPDAASWFAGGIVTYSAQSKRAILHVSAGPVVSRTCAQDMAIGVARLFGADIAAAVTGVGGPGAQEGQPPGTVWFAVAGLGATLAEHALLPGAPSEVVDQAVTRALGLLRAQLQARSG